MHDYLHACAMYLLEADGRTDGQTDGQADRRTDGRTDGRTDRRTGVSREGQRSKARRGRFIVSVGGRAGGRVGRGGRVLGLG